MTLGISTEQVRRIAALARLRLPADEARSMAAALDSILRHMDALQEVTDLGAPDGAGDAAPQRSDRESADALSVSPDALAPEWRDGFFVVPRLGSHAVARPDAGGVESE